MKPSVFAVALHAASVFATATDASSAGAEDVDLTLLRLNGATGHLRPPLKAEIRRGGQSSLRIAPLLLRGSKANEGRALGIRGREVDHFTAGDRDLKSGKNEDEVALDPEDRGISDSGKRVKGGSGKKKKKKGSDATSTSSTSAGVVSLSTAAPPSDAASSTCVADSDCAMEWRYCDYGGGHCNCTAVKKPSLGKEEGSATATAGTPDPDEVITGESDGQGGFRPVSSKDQECEEGTNDPDTGKKCQCVQCFADPCMLYGQPFCESGECKLAKKTITLPSTDVPPGSSSTEQPKQPEDKTLPDSMLRELNATRTTWEEEAGWENYDVVMNVQCGALAGCMWDENKGRNIVLNVRDNAVNSSSTVGNYPTIPNLFDFIQSMIEDKTKGEMEVRYNQLLGYPEEFSVVYIGTDWEDETSIRVLKIKSREDGAPDPVLEKCGWKNEIECGWEKECCNKGCGTCTPLEGQCAMEFCPPPFDEPGDEGLVTRPPLVEPKTVSPPQELVFTTPAPIELTKPETGIKVDAELARLKINMEKWMKSGPPDEYEYTYHRSCFCPIEWRGPFRSRAKGGKVVSVALDVSQLDIIPNPGSDKRQAVDPKAVPTVMEMFEMIQKSIEAGSAKVNIEYEEKYGFPRSGYIDHDLMIADEEMSFTMENFAVIATGTDATIPAAGSTTQEA
mmetsp:Transcript_55130/g.165164  ORF Transcript_55130/g.165164 Transcript_55130/m.165164 type:complete len:676 (-) Transcript_55130:371-2398(-)